MARRRNSMSIVFAWIGVAVVCLALVLIVVTWFVMRSNQVELAEANCPKDQRNIPIHLVYLLDVSDELSETQRAFLEVHLRDKSRSLPKFSLIDFYLVSDDEMEPATLLTSTCRPVHPQIEDERSTLDRLSTNDRILQRDWEERFLPQLDLAIETVRDQKSLSSSPIIESLRIIVLENVRNRWGEIHDTRFIIVSDMIQNSSALSHYQKNWRAPQELSDDETVRLRAELRSIDVEILYLRREGEIQGKTHINWWREYLSKSEASVTNVKSVN